MNVTYEPNRDFYTLLGVTGAVSSEGIRQAYLKCARRAHPDRDRTNQAATENFQDVQAAYETLKDEVKRARYDKVRVEAIRREDGRKREEDSWGRSRNRRRQGPPGAQAPQQQQNGQDKYFPYDRRAPKPAPASKPPPGASTAWEEMKRARGTGKSAGAPPQAGAQRPNPSAPPRPGPHPTSKLPPKKPASQRPGSFAQWAKEQPTTPVTPTKNGYRPNSSTVGDEPRAKSSSYQSARKADPFGPSMDSEDAEAVPKSRPSQPYQTTHGEKTKLFDGGRTESTAEEDRGRKPFKATPAPEQGWNPSGTQRHFWPHPETTSETPNNKRSESLNSPAERSPFEKEATGTPGPWFASEATEGAFTFTAGSETSGRTTPVRKTRSSGHLGRKEAGSPTKKRRPEPAEGFSNAAAPESPNLKFDPSEWTQTFGPQTFIPRSTQRSPVSPVRQARSTLKKSATNPRPPSKAPRPATVSDDKTSDEGGGASTRRDQPKTTGMPHAAPSPNAMDIDWPPPRPSTVSTPTPAATSSRTTRDVPVEPSKPEWRAGTGAGGKPKDDAKSAAAAAAGPAPAPATQQPIKPTTGGSEDTDEFRATLDELKKVPPFAPQGGGLSSLADLGSSLPFTSRPSESLPLKQPRKKAAARAASGDHHPPLEIPAAPLAPVFPATIGANGIRPTREVFETYARAFEAYQREWNTYNGIFVAHFTERQRRVSAAAGAAKLRFREQLGWARQDAQVRTTWAAACEEHDRRLEEYLAVLEKMGSV